MANVQTITCEELKRILKESPNDVAIIDIREPDEVARERLASSINIPMSTLKTATYPCQGRRIAVFHCRSGNRTRLAEGDFGRCGISEIYCLEGGLEAWKQKGFPVVSDRKAPIEIMRQVQIIAGTLVVTGVILGATVSHHFYWISGAVGAGLMFAGISGTCMMANLLRKLPYNRRSR